MKVLVIPEDFRKDQYMLKPIIKAMLKSLGKPRAKVMICQDPLLGGISEALKWDNIASIIEQYSMVDLFLLCVDRDGKDGRQFALDKIEAQANNVLNNRQCFFAENAWQELEVWLLAGHALPKNWNWTEIRAEINPKEVYFLPFAASFNLLTAPGEGRKLLAEEAAQRYDRIRQLCPEDIAHLEQRIQTLLEP